MVIGDPCHGNYFAWMSRFFPNCEHGDVTIDLNGCSRCNQMNINDMDAWSQFDTNSFVIMESGTISFSEDIEKVLKEIRRISGGDFFSGGGTWGFLWENFLYKTYDKNLNYVTYPFDFRDNKNHKSKNLKTKEILELEFMKL